MTTLESQEHVAFAEPSLVVHAFAPFTTTPADRNPARAHLRSLWEACARLGLSEALLPGVATSFAWPETASDRFVILAAMGTPGDGHGRQAMMFGRHDVVGLAVAFDDPVSSKELDGWRELFEMWKEATDGLSVPETLLGETLTFLCAYDAPSTDRLHAIVGRAMRSCGLRIWDTPFEPQTGVVAWDGDDAGSRRVVAALASLGSRDDLSRLFWWAGEHELARMAQYQVHAAKVRYEERVHRLRRAELAAAVERVARAVDESLEAHAELDARSTSATASAERRLIEAQADSAGLVIQLSYLRALRRTVDIARHNMALTASESIGTGAGVSGTGRDTMVDRDRALAMRLSEQVEHDIGYAEALGERARHATSLSALRLQQSQERLQAGRSRLVLFQTALLSALLTGIGAIATFDMSLEVAPPIRFPLLATLVTVLVAAPIVAASWHDGFRPLDRLVIGLFGASLAWLGLTSAFPSAPWVVAAAAVAAGAGVSQLLAIRHRRRDDVATS
jgi:hypothetical protein